VILSPRTLVWLEVLSPEEYNERENVIFREPPLQLGNKPRPSRTTYIKRE
jgi:hypothetical protein